VFRSHWVTQCHLNNIGLPRNLWFSIRFATCYIKQSDMHKSKLLKAVYMLDYREIKLKEHYCQ